MVRLLGHPHAEAREGRRDGRHAEGHRFQRGVSPRLVVRSEDRQVHACEQVVVGHVEYAVVAREIGRHEEHFDARRGGREYAALDALTYGVPRLVLDIVRQESLLCGVDRIRRILQVRLQIDAHAHRGGRHCDYGEHLAACGVALRELLQRFEEYVYALVAELVAAAGGHDQRLALELVVPCRLGHGDHLAACLGALAFEGVALGYESVLESVGRDARNLASQQIFALVGRDVAHGKEGIGICRCGLLDRVFGHDVELARQLVGVELVQVVIERQTVAGDAAAYDGRMRREYRSHVGCVVAQVEAAGRCHPLVEVGYHLVRRRAELLDVRSYHFACGVAEQYGLDIVPLSREGVDVIYVPQFFEYVVFLRKVRFEVDEYRHGRAFDIPASYAHADALRVETLAPCGQQSGVLGELGVAAVLREVGTDGNVLVAHSASDRRRLGGYYRVYAAYLVANLPTDFEQKVGGQIDVTHTLYFYLLIVVCIIPCKGNTNILQRQFY